VSEAGEDVKQWIVVDSDDAGTIAELFEDGRGHVLAVYQYDAGDEFTRGFLGVVESGQAKVYSILSQKGPEAVKGFYVCATERLAWETAERAKQGGVMADARQELLRGS
jgi:hypothetical protein